jgi:hypothetical protein
MAQIAEVEKNQEITLMDDIHSMLGIQFDDDDNNKRVVACCFDALKKDRGDGVLRALTEQEMNRIVWKQSEISLYGKPSLDFEVEDFVFKYIFKSSGGFTVRKLVSVMESFEKSTRHHHLSDGIIDIVYVMFNGLRYSAEHEAFKVQWLEYSE